MDRFQPYFIALIILSFLSISPAQSNEVNMSNHAPHCNHSASKVICTRTKLRKDALNEVQNWLKTLQDRKYEVIETFRDEGVWIESAFLEKAGEDYYLLFYIRADDVEHALTTFQKSTHPIDVFHKECWRKYATESSTLELVFDLERPRNTDQIKKPENILVDVIQLSKKRCPTPIQGSLAYALKENFLGRPVDGYSPNAAEVCLVSRKAAEQLCAVQNELHKQGLGLFVFDAYRPLRAVKDFSQWFHEPPASEYEKERKKLHYPNLEKTDLAPLGYAPNKVSRHCFGNSIDLALIDLSSGQLLDMGTLFDCFDATSHHPAASPEIIGNEAYQNRELLAQVMKKFGFVPYPLEYWHFDYQERELDEPGDIEITLSLSGLNVP